MFQLVVLVFLALFKLEKEERRVRIGFLLWWSAAPDNFPVPTELVLRTLCFEIAHLIRNRFIFFFCLSMSHTKISTTHGLVCIKSLFTPSVDIIAPVLYLKFN